MQQRSIFARSETGRISRNALLPYLLFFFAAGFGGWLWEVLVYWVQHSGEYSLPELLGVYRGVLHGPWAPIYGVGAVWMVLLRAATKQGPLRYFLTCAGVCAGVEYLTSWGLEAMFHARWWDYTGCFLNLNGRICAMSILFFAAAGMAVAYGVAPCFWRLVRRAPQPGAAGVCISLTLLFLLDLLRSLVSPNLGVGVLPLA